ncbi:MAG: cysteine desulfurase, partial [Candidatus Yonathbacteria bacterium]|nr:cysteine desulfurase [Candidatus Yonathbacteria bacterium]
MNYMLDPATIKKDFPIFESNPALAYLDSASTSQTPLSVVAAMDEYYKKYRANIHRGVYDLSETATDKYEHARETVARFLSAEPEEIIFTAGSTLASNMLVYSLEETLDLKKGDEIVTTIMEHHSSLIPLQELASRRGCTLKYIPLTKDVELDYEKARELITPKTKIISVTLASNVLGTINDIKRLSALAEEQAAILIVDAAQAVGHMPISVRELGCDFLFFSGHKMCGPTGIGVLYGKKERLASLRPSLFGGSMVERVDTHTAEFASTPARFEAGTQNIAGAIGLAAAIEYLSRIGLPNIEHHVRDITLYALAQLGSIKGVTLYCAGDPRKNAGIVSFLVEGIHPHDVAEIESRDQVAVRSGHHCAQPLMSALGVTALVRASFYLYNSKEDVDKLVLGIKKAQNIF